MSFAPVVRAPSLVNVAAGNGVNEPMRVGNDESGRTCAPGQGMVDAALTQRFEVDYLLVSQDRSTRH